MAEPLKDNPTTKGILSSGGSRATLYWTYNRTSQRVRDPVKEKEKRERKKKQIVKIKKTQPFFCQKIPILLIYLQNNQVEKIVRNYLRCKTWTCPVCASINAVEAYYKIRDTAIINSLNYFLTLTLDPKKIPEYYFENNLNRTHKYITYLFNRFATQIRKKNNDFKYIWVIEFHKKGNAHIHILLNIRLDINYVRAEWTRIGGGRIMRVEEVQDIRRIASYVSSYIAKGLKTISTGNIGFFHWEKRYAISQSCIRPKKTYVNLDDNPVLLEQLRSVITGALLKENDTITDKKP